LACGGCGTRKLPRVRDASDRRDLAIEVNVAIQQPNDGENTATGANARNNVVADSTGEFRLLVNRSRSRCRLYGFFIIGYRVSL
jgi:hypothetical protein